MPKFIALCWIVPIYELLPNLCPFYQVMPNYAKLTDLCSNLKVLLELCQNHQIISTFAKVIPKFSSYFKFCQIYHVMSYYDNLWKFAKVMQKIYSFAILCQSYHVMMIFSPKTSSSLTTPFEKRGNKNIRLNCFSYYCSLHSIFAFTKQMIIFFNKWIRSFILRSYVFPIYHITFLIWVLKLFWL